MQPLIENETPNEIAIMKAFRDAFTVGAKDIDLGTNKIKLFGSNWLCWAKNSTNILMHDLGHLGNKLWQSHTSIGVIDEMQRDQLNVAKYQ